MKRLLQAICLALLPLLAAPILPAAADGCYICRSGSSCGQYCRYAGRDSFAKRKACIKAGCKIGGTASCPTAANVRICSGIGSLFDLTPKHAAVPGHTPRQTARPGRLTPAAAASR